MRTDLKAFRKSGLANCFGRQQPIEGRVPVLVAPRRSLRPVSLLSAVWGPLYQSHVLTPHFHSAATRRRSFPIDSAVYACMARSARGITGGWDSWDRAPLSSQRLVPYPRGQDG